MLIASAHLHTHNPWRSAAWLPGRFCCALVSRPEPCLRAASDAAPPLPRSEGGFFNAVMKFPKDYPQMPPTLQFTSEFWHPNVYPDGKVCISILHSPGEV